MLYVFVFIGYSKEKYKYNFMSIIVFTKLTESVDKSLHNYAGFKVHLQIMSWQSIESFINIM